MSSSIYLSPVLFLLSKNPRRGRAECWAAGPQEQGCWGPVAKAGTWHAPGDQFGILGQAEGRVVPVLAQPELLLLWHRLHFGSASCTLRQQSGTSSCSHTGSVGVCSKTRTSHAEEEALQTGLATMILPLGRAFSATLPAQFRSYHHLSTVLCSTPLRRRGQLLRGCGHTAETCCPRWYTAQNSQSFILIIDGTSGLGCVRDEGSGLVFSVPSVGRE